MKNEYIPLGTLMFKGRNPSHRVGLSGEQWVLWGDFQAQVARYAFVFSQRLEARWLLVSEDPLVFVAQLLALLHAGKQAVIPPNVQVGALQALRSEYDAIVDFLPKNDAPLLELSVLSGGVVCLYTSGSTGVPKPIRKTLRQFEVESALLESHFGEALGACGVLGSAPHHHLYGLTFRVLWPLAAGRTIDNVTCSHPDMLVERLNAMGGGLLVSSPAQLSRWPDLMCLPNLPIKPKMILSSGGALLARSAQILSQQLHAPLVEIYGSSETGVMAWRGVGTGVLWQPFRGVHVQADERGALIVRSPLLGEGSWCRIEDAVEVRPFGQFELKGRLDRTVKIEEKRVFLPDMERCLGAHEAVEEVALVLLPGARQTLGAVLVLTAQGQHFFSQYGKRRLVQLLRAHLFQYFDQVLVPRRWRVAMQLPLSERGKLMQTTLIGMFDDDE